jgi:hypothetical protein
MWGMSLLLLNLLMLLAGKGGGWGWGWGGWSRRVARSWGGGVRLFGAHFHSALFALEAL